MEIIPHKNRYNNNYYAILTTIKLWLDEMVPLTNYTKSVKL